MPDADVTRGVATAWLVLAAVGLGADRRLRRGRRPARQPDGAPGGTARRRRARGSGRATWGCGCPRTGPAELRAAAAAFNAMADQVVQLLAAERELAADLSHRLRTPLTVLRLNTASLGDGPRRRPDPQGRRPTGARGRHRSSAPPASSGPVAARRVTAGCDAAEVIRERMAFWSALAEDEGREVRTAGVERPVRVPVARGRTGRRTRRDARQRLPAHPARAPPSPSTCTAAARRKAVIVLVSDAGPGVARPGRRAAPRARRRRPGLHRARPRHRAPRRGVHRRRHAPSAAACWAARRYGCGWPCRTRRVGAARAAGAGAVTTPLPAARQARLTRPDVGRPPRLAARDTRRTAGRHRGRTAAGRKARLDTDGRPAASRTASPPRPPTEGRCLRAAPFGALNGTHKRLQLVPGMTGVFPLPRADSSLLDPRPPQIEAPQLSTNAAGHRRRGRAVGA